MFNHSTQSCSKEKIQYYKFSLGTIINCNCFGVDTDIFGIDIGTEGYYVTYEYSHKNHVFQIHDYIIYF